MILGMGRPPKPTNLKLLHGDDKKNPKRINRNEPVPAVAVVAPPAWLSEAARAEWDRLAPDLKDKGVLTAWDVPAFAVLCDAIANHAAASGLVAQAGVLVKGRDGRNAVVRNPAVIAAKMYAETVVTLAGRFGLTPSDRARLNLAEREPGEDDDLLTWGAEGTKRPNR